MSLNLNSSSFPLRHSLVSNHTVWGHLRPWSDCTDVQADLILHCLHMPTDTFSHVPGHLSQVMTYNIKPGKHFQTGTYALLISFYDLAQIFIVLWFLNCFIYYVCDTLYKAGRHPTPPHSAALLFLDFFISLPLRKHAYSNILKISPPKTKVFR